MKSVLLILLALLMPVAITSAQDADTRRLLELFRGEFIEVTPGRGKFPKSFLMGSVGQPEQPQHRVTFTYQFAIAKYEVPQNLWEAVMGHNPSRWKGPRNSVEMLSFEEAVSFCKKVTKLLQTEKLIDADQVVRLPSEAEWEYVARAGTKTTYSFGDNKSKLDEYAWSTHNAAGNDPPVGAKLPNPWGLYDIHGYLWEWCLDFGHANYEGAPTDGSAWKEDGIADTRVLRSGSWKDRADSLTSSYRKIVKVSLRDDAVGLRCVLSKRKKN